jgi:uncharacterized protein (DUF2141 family)
MSWALLLAAGVLGDPGCGTAPAIRVAVEGLKDRRGELKLELYPDTEHDWLRDDRDLLREGKLFRRVRVPVPADGPVTLCIRVPGPGRYALFFTHNRDGRNKFSFWTDGAGLPGNARIGRARPKLEQGVVEVGGGTAGVTIRAQYLRGLSGFGPLR